MNNLLVTTDWLAANLDRVRVVDIRGHVLPATEPLPHYYNHRDDYLKAHLPGAVFIDWVQEITDPADPRHAKIAPPERYADVMRRIGVNDDSFVVAYDDAASMFAARLWWSLNYYGHRQVAVLDGGWQKWVAEGRPTTAEIPTYAAGDFSPRPTPELLRSGNQVLTALRSGQQLIDVRTPAEFRGEASRAKRGGHIPTAINLPRTALIDASGQLLPPDKLRELFAAAGVTSESSDVVFYCNGGVSASFGLLALRAAGLAHGSVYDGSWKDWANDDTKPVE
ncbi:MAG: sulfurtransferase [Chloroflexi bacterium]|nr:sulfurtransferase [Chloroflexota bacterium]